MEKRPYPVFPRISFVLSVLSMIGIVDLTVNAVKSYIELSSRNASGHEWLGFAIYPVFYGFISLVGTISSAFCGIKTTITWVKIVSFIMLGIFGMILFLCFMGMGNMNGIGRIFGWFANLFVG